MYGKSALDEPTGTKKYSMAPMSAGEKAASRERKSNNLIDRNLQRAMRRGSPAERIAAGQLYQKRSSTPGYQQGGGIASADDNREADRITASNYTKEGLQLKNNLNQNVNPGTAQDANDVERGPVNVIGRELPGGTTPYTNTPTPFQGSYSPEYFAKEAFRTEPNISEKGTNPNNIAEGLASTQGVGNANNPVPVATTSQEAPAATTSPATPNTPAPLDTMADRGNSKIAGYQKATADAKTKFANDLKQYGTSGQRSPERDAQIREYGKTLNLNEDQINAAMRGDTKLDAKSAAASTLAYEKNVANKAANTPEARNKKSTDEFSKAYGNYLNGEGKGASKEERAAKYDELKGKATKDGFVVTKEAEDKVAKDRFDARVERAVKAGTPREEAILTTSYEDNSTQETLDLIPGAKKDIADLLNSYDGLSKQFENVNGPAQLQGIEKLKELRGPLDPDYKNTKTDISALETGSNNVNFEDIVKQFDTREVLSGLDKGEWNLGKGQGVLDQQAAPNKPTLQQQLQNGTYDPTQPLQPVFNRNPTKSPESNPTLPESQENAVASAESKRNPILQDLTDAGNVWDSRWKRDARIVNNQLKKEGDFARSFTKTVGGGLIDVFGSAVGGKTGEKIKSGADAFEETIDNLNLSRPQASVNTKRSIQKSATDVLSFSDNLNKYLV